MIIFIYQISKKNELKQYNPIPEILALPSELLQKLKKVAETQSGLSF